MFKNSSQKITILQYWTHRYVFTLLIGLLLLGAGSIWWVRTTAIDNKLQQLKVFVQDIADRVDVQHGMMYPNDKLPQMIENRKGFFQLKDDFTVEIVDRDDKKIFSVPGKPLPKPARAEPPPPITSAPSSPSAKAPPPPVPAPPPVSKLEEKVYTISASVMYGNEVVGTVHLATTERSINEVNQEYTLLAFILSGFALLGWLVIYLLSKKLSSPIRLVAHAAKQIKTGNYHIELPNDAKELEIHELFISFKEMAMRLNQLEDLRTEMLAGVTHELKTPLTSIRGLIYAVKDKIVTDEEANEFLDISIKETDRLQHMVHELLDFNSFVAGVITLTPVSLKLNELIREMVYQWSIIHQNDHLHLLVHTPDDLLEASGDTSRIQQIMINLLNNSKEAMEGAGTIEITLYSALPDHIAVDIKDTGCGIPPAEQMLVFERFYRGNNKKHTLRGLGLGLAFSRTLAKAMGGDLLLKESTPQGTTFTLLLQQWSSKAPLS